MEVTKKKFQLNFSKVMPARPKKNQKDMGCEYEYISETSTSGMNDPVFVIR